MIVFYLYADMPHDSNQQLVFFTLTVLYLTDQRDIDEILVYPRIKTICLTDDASLLKFQLALLCSRAIYPK